MSQARNKNSYTFFMPYEERIFFRYFHLIAGVILLIFFSVSTMASKVPPENAVLFAAIPVLAMYMLRAIFGKRMVQSITLDFDTGTVTIVFPDNRETLERPFQDIQLVYFRFYLTFVLSDIRVMVKRPRNKKEVYRLLKSVTHVDIGIFKGF